MKTQPPVFEDDYVGQHSMEHIHSCSDGVRERLFEQAQDVTRRFFIEWKTANKAAYELAIKQPGSVNPYVRMEDSLEIVWKKYKGVLHESNGTTIRHQPDYISKGKGFAYPTKRLQSCCREWEWEIVSRYEAEYAAIRKAFAALTTLRRNARQLDMCLLAIPTCR